MLNNPARQLYMNMDIEKLSVEDKPKSGGLLAPKNNMSKKTDSKNLADKPAYRVAQHMRILREQRELLKNGN